MSYIIEDDDEGSLGTGPGEGLTESATSRPGDNPDVPSAPSGAQGGALTSDSGVPSDAGVGGEVVQGTEKDAASDAGLADPAGTQDEPAMDMHDASTQAKIDGIVAQTRADFPEGSDPADFEHALRRRFDDTGIAVDDAQITKLARG